jgi:dTDP-glucose pyrophosphorylase
MIVIPMAGLSSRFFKAGYTKPKYMLEAHGESLFAHAIKSFSEYFKKEEFLFIVRDVLGTVDFIKQEIATLGIKNAQIFILDKETRGQAETVYLGLQSLSSDEDSITIFNIDTFRPEFRYPKNTAEWDGYLEVFVGEGDNWSFAKPLHSDTSQVIETAEKRPISNLCSTGLYYFKSIALFNLTYCDYLAKPEAEWEKGELYIAPLYNYLIQEQKNIHYYLIERNEVIFCGVPDEYLTFLEI